LSGESQGRSAAQRGHPQGTQPIAAEPGDHAQTHHSGARRFLPGLHTASEGLEGGRALGRLLKREANARLRRNHGLIASFSRALVEGLSAQQSDAEFNAMLDKYIQSIFDASNT
jgi:fructose-bisphosphate aldolase class 1